MTELINMAATGGLSAGLGAGLSLISKVVNLSAENKKLALARNVGEMAALTTSRDAADKRGGVGGIWIRRFIVVSLFGFLFLMLPIVALFGQDATYAYMEQIPERWFGLIRAKAILRTIPLEGVPVFEQAVNMMWLIGTFYFGSSRIK